ncbi:pyridoxal 5'-phosphate synthase glutaminase subunit PdxT [Candidatus Woesearchaeota archaeon]|nr:pyridoxal 5'-phosphate synthase glutaminase subunit PdxT [Candidatus Woesearchaeota archaeon]
MVTVGILALQGAFIEHEKVLVSLGVRATEVRTCDDLRAIDALILPGGESTVMSKLMRQNRLDTAIIDLSRKGMPLYGVCAGAILLAKQAEENTVKSLGLMDITVKRNAYGSQIDSFEADVSCKELGNIHGIFIRAPIITDIGKEVEVLGKYDNQIVLAKQKNILVSTFHPELSSTTKVHELFLRLLSHP